VFVVGDSDIPLSRETRKIIHVANCLRNHEKVSSCCRKDNPDTNISTALALSATVILSILCDFTIIQLLKIVINLKSS
jgi:hypothetical protein